MSIRDLASQRARHAFKCAEEAKRKNLTDYPNNVKKFPTMIRNAGFAKAVAFGYSKGGVYEEINKNIIEWLKEKGIIEEVLPTKDFINKLINMNTLTYRHAINETMSLFEWLRRFAEGMFPEKKEG
jgi:CRISPR-associated protein Cmr5